MVRFVAGSFCQEKPALVHGLVPDDISKLTEISSPPPVYTNGVLNVKAAQPTGAATDEALELYTCVEPVIRVAQVCGGVCTAVSEEFFMYTSNRKFALEPAARSLYQATSVITAPAGSPVSSEVV
jgi:hypothetical protein